MPKIINNLDARSEITEIKALNDQIVAFSTRSHGIKLFAVHESELKLSLITKHLNAQTKAIAFSNDGSFVTFANETYIFIIHMPTNEIIKKIPIEEDVVEILSFDLSSSYIIAGTKRGRVLQYKCNDVSLLSRLCSFPCSKVQDKDKVDKNFVSAFAFHSNKLACTGYGGAIYVLDLHSHIKKEVFTHNRIRSDALCFLDEDRVANGDCHGVIHIRSLKDKRVHKKINTPFTKVKQIILMPNKDYIMVCGQTNTLAVIDIKNYKIVHTKYIECEAEIQRISLLDDETLLIALKNAQILNVFLPSLKQLKSFILHNSLDLAYELIAREPMLRGSLEHQELEATFYKIYLQAIDALIHHNEKLALQLTDIFKNVLSKKVQIRELFTAFNNYPKLQSYFTEKNHALAYALVLRFPPLEHTWQYKRMEQTWKQAFMSAQKQMILSREENAKLCLNDYMMVSSKRPLIQLILKQNKEFIEFLKAIGEKDYFKVHHLALKNETFTQIPTYKALKEKLQEDLNEIKGHINKCDVDLAEEMLLKLKNLPTLAQEVSELYEKCQNIQELRKAYKKSDFLACYNILDTHDNLYSTELGLLLERHWLKIVHNCEEFALKGNIRDIKASLGELIHITERRSKIGDLLRLSFHVKIKTLLAQKSFKKAENIIYSYADIFGRDSEISSIMKKYEAASSKKLAITHDQQNSRDNWIHSDIIMKGRSSV